MHGRSRRFESCQLHKQAVVAQLVEQLTCNEQVTGSNPVNGSMKMKMKCDLCKLERRTTVYEDNKALIILDCDSCQVPMVVWKEHTMHIDKMDESIMRGMLVDVGYEFYKGDSFRIDTVQNEIPDHLHWHARPTDPKAKGYKEIKNASK